MKSRSRCSQITMESILTSIKKLLGIAEEHTDFDADLIMHINSVFSILTQIGVGPTEGFTISGESDKWEDFTTSNKLEHIKTYMYLKVKLMFDPPLSSAVMESYNRTISELEWRISISGEEENVE